MQRTTHPHFVTEKSQKEKWGGIRDKQSLKIQSLFWVPELLNRHMQKLRMGKTLARATRKPTRLAASSEKVCGSIASSYSS